MRITRIQSKLFGYPYESGIEEFIRIYIRHGKIHITKKQPHFFQPYINVRDRFYIVCK